MTFILKSSLYAMFCILAHLFLVVKVGDYRLRRQPDEARQASGGAGFDMNVALNDADREQYP
jgi:hypothetical protein